MTRDGFTFFHRIRVRYSEIDRQGVLFNAHYLTYYDTAITEYFRAIAYDQYSDALASGVDFHVVKSTVEYKRPILLDQEVDVGVRVARIGNSSLAFDLAIFARDAADLLATGEIVWVNTDQRSHRPATISDDIRRRLTAREAQPFA